VTQRVHCGTSLTTSTVSRPRGKRREIHLLVQAA
jgi:hypothetical protein